MLVKQINTAQFAKTAKFFKTLLQFPGSDTAITLEAKEGSLNLIADTSGFQIKISLDATIEKEGSVVIDSNHLGNLLLRSDYIFLSYESGKSEISLKCGRSTYQLKTLEHEPYKLDIPENPKDTFQVMSNFLKLALKNVSMKHEDESSKDLRIILRNGEMLVETADDFKSCIWSYNVKLWKKQKNTIKAVLKKELAETVFSFFDNESTLWVDTAKSNLRLYDNKNLISIPLITETTLIDIEDTMKSTLSSLKKTQSFQIESAELSDIVTEATSVINSKDQLKNSQIMLFIDGKKKKLTIETEGDIGNFKHRLQFQNYQGGTDVNKICVSSKQLKGILSTARKGNKLLELEVWDKMLVVLRSVEEQYSSIYCLTQLVAD